MVQQVTLGFAEFVGAIVQTYLNRGTLFLGVANPQSSGFLEPVTWCRVLKPSETLLTPWLVTCWPYTEPQAAGLVSMDCCVLWPPGHLVSPCQIHCNPVVRGGACLAG